MRASDESRWGRAADPDGDRARARRSTIETAKVILMDRHGIDALTAFTMLNRHSRRRRVRLVDVAASVVISHGLFGPRDAGRP